MTPTADAWYVRLPDGRVLRAASTAIVRQNLGTGRIPAGSRVRRTPDEEWTALEWMEEFADLLKRSQESPAVSPSLRETGSHRTATTVTSRLDPDQLHVVGVRGLADELAAALDSALAPGKLATAVLAGLALGLLFALARYPLLDLEGRGPYLQAAVAGLIGLLVAATASGILTQLTYLELSRLRRVPWAEGRAGLGQRATRLTVAYLLVIGNALLLILLLRLLPTWFLPAEGMEQTAGQTLAAGAATVLALVLEVALWLVIGFSMLLAPALVIEETSVGTGLRLWARLVRQDFGRAFLYEALALAVGLVATLPLVLPLWATLGAHTDPRLVSPAAFTRDVLTGLALAPLLAYLVVANVFIYLNLRYELAGRRQ
jgi:hypothetical protein